MKWLTGVLLVLVSVAAWLALRGGEPLEPAAAARASAGADDLTQGPLELVGADASAAERRAGTTATAAAPGAPESDRPGRLELRFVDSGRGEPVADLAWVLFSERRSGFVAASGRSDDRGCAEIDRLPADAWLVLTERRPPHASTLAAIWLEPGAERTVEIRLDRGGAVVGRIVDDLGAPRAGIAIEVASLPVAGRALAPAPAFDRAAATVAATTGDDGRFRVEAVLSRPFGVWIDDAGEPRPERLEPLVLSVRSPEAVGREPLEVETHARSGAVTELGDVVLPRSARVSGTVVDSTGAPLAGTLTTVVADRRRGMTERPWRDRGRPLPWEPGFEVGPSEALTDAAGRFTLAVPGTVANGRERTEIVLWTATGRRSNVPGPLLLPGEHVEDLRVEVPFQLEVIVDLEDARGAPIAAAVVAREDADRTVALAASEGFVRGLVAGLASPQVLLTGRPSDGEPWGASLRVDPDGVARGTSRRAVEPGFDVELSLSGYEPAYLVLHGDGPQVLRGRAVLERSPVRRLLFDTPSQPTTRTAASVVLVGVADVGGDETAVWYQTFELWSDRLPFALDLIGGDGVVGSVEVRIADEPVAAFDALPARDEPFPVAVEFARGAVRGGADGAPPVEPVAVVDERPATVRVEVVSAADGAPLAGATVHWRRRDDDDARVRPAVTDARGRAALDVAVDASLVLELAHVDHRDATISLDPLAPGELATPAAMALERLPRFTVAVRDDVGRPVAGARVRLDDLVAATTDAAGAVSLPVPTRAGPSLIAVERPLSGLDPLDGVTYHRWIDAAAPGATIAVDCGAWRVVELQLDREPRFTAPMVLTRTPAGELPRVRAATLGTQRVAAGDVGANYRFAVGLGPWVALVHGPGGRLELALDVVHGTGAQVFAVEVPAGD